MVTLQEVLRTYGLSKRYGRGFVVDDININVRRGEVYGFLGLNGAGKTTVIRMILGLIKPSSGEVELFGERIKQGSYDYYERIGVKLENPGFYPNLTVLENLSIHKRLMGVTGKESIEKALDSVSLLSERNKKVKELSLGARQRLAIARALLNNPELLILDEPTNGLDPTAIKEVRQLIVELAQKRKITVFMSSHVLSEVEQIATRAGIIHRGRMLKEFDFEAFRENSSRYTEIRVGDDKKAAMMLEKELNLSDYKVIQPGLIRVYEGGVKSHEINRTLVICGVDVKELVIRNNTLEEYFIGLTGERPGSNELLEKKTAGMGRVTDV